MLKTMYDYLGDQMRLLDTIILYVKHDIVPLKFKELKNSMLAQMEETAVLGED